ncbi:MAG: ABC transporter ATP-binding protein [Pseudomonadota bacterium]|nr:ABC transporter ATP-binding protein [Pseudomonadota bacterium]
MITIQNIRFGYPKSATLFTDMSFAIKKGGIYGLLGKNGAGKTSLLKILSGLVFPQSGSCTVLDEVPSYRHPDFLANVYLLPEDLYVPPITAQEFCRCYAPFYSAFDNSIYQDAAKQFEIPDDKCLTEMSHGQKKKFLIAFGIATKARLFIMDEPTNGLDIPSKTLFRQLLATHFSDDRIFIISTHQVHDIQNLIDHIILLDCGNIIFNHAIVDVAQKLTFTRQTQQPEPQSCLYYEKQLGGYMVIAENTSTHETEIDLEVLFNALSTNTLAFEKLLA